MVLLNLKRRIFLFLLFQCTAGSTANIISTPPVDAGGCYGGLSAFYCGSDRSDMTILHWHINSDILTNQEMMIRGISIDTTTTDEHANSTLSIIGLPINDGILVGCTFVTLSPPYITTGSAILTVSDIPPVEDLNIVFNDSVMIITWTEPSHLPIHYTYTIIITDDSYNQTLANTNTTDSLYTLPLVSVCTTNYTVSVSVVDTSGYTQEVSTSVVETRLRNITADLSIRLFNESVRFVDSTSCYSDINFEIMTKNLKLEDIVLCYGKDSVDTFIKNVLPEILLTALPRNISLLDSLENDTNIGSYSFGPFSERVNNGSLLLQLREWELGGAVLNFSTFHVQNFSHNLQNGTSELICTFAENSTANGCNVTLTSRSLSENNITMIHIPKTKDETTATGCANISGGSYSVSVFDDINDGSEGPAIIKYISIPLIDSMDDNREGSFVSNGTSVTTVFSNIASPSISSPLTSSDPWPTQGFHWYPVVGSVCGVVLLCLVVVIFLLICFVKEKKKKRAKVAVRQERVMVGIFNRNKNDYEPHAITYTAHHDDELAAVVISIPEQQVDDDGEDFQHPNEFVSSTSYQVQNGEEVYEKVTCHGLRNVTQESNEGVISEHDLSNTVDASLQLSVDITTEDEQQSPATTVSTYVSSDDTQQQSDLPAELDEACQCHVGEVSDPSQDKKPYSNVVVGGAKKFCNPAPSTIPSGSKLDTSQYVELADLKDGSQRNEQRPIPRQPEPPPVYSSIVPTVHMNHSTENTRFVNGLTPQSKPDGAVIVPTHQKNETAVSVGSDYLADATANPAMVTDDESFNKPVLPSVPAVNEKLSDSHDHHTMKGHASTTTTLPDNDCTQHPITCNDRLRPEFSINNGKAEHSYMYFFSVSSSDNMESFDEPKEPRDSLDCAHSQMVCPQPHKPHNGSVVCFQNTVLVCLPHSDLSAQNYDVHEGHGIVQPRLRNDSIGQNTNSINPPVKLYTAYKDVQSVTNSSIEFNLMPQCLPKVPKTIMWYCRKIINLINDRKNQITKMCYSLCNSCGLAAW